MSVAYAVVLVVVAVARFCLSLYALRRARQEDLVGVLEVIFAFGRRRGRSCTCRVPAHACRCGESCGPGHTEVTGVPDSGEHR